MDRQDIEKSVREEIARGVVVDVDYEDKRPAGWPSAVRLAFAPVQGQVIMVPVGAYMKRALVLNYVSFARDVSDRRESISVGEVALRPST
jgi:hypothetical protein